MKKVIIILLLLAIPHNAHSEEKRYVVPLEDSPSYGLADAPVTIIEFLDFQ